VSDWTEWAVRLTQPGEERSVDDVIDELTAAILSAPPVPDASAVLREGLWKATSSLSTRSAAIALAYCAASDDRETCDAFTELFNRHRVDAFLGPAILAAWALLAERSALARADVAAALLRLTGNEGRYLLVKAAQVAGRLEESRTDPDIRAVLARLSGSDDPAVAGEARQQEAMIAFQDALLAPDRRDLRERLREVRAAFARAEASEEQRPDARLFGLLLDAVLRFLDGGVMGDVQAAIRVPLRECVQLLHDGGPAFWGAYHSDDQDRLATHALGVVDTLRHAAEATSDADQWLDLEEAVLRLAALHARMRQRPLFEGHDRSVQALSALTEVALIPPLGPLLACAVTGTRLRRVVANYVSLHGEDEIAQGLRALEEAARRCEPLAAIAPNEGLLRQIAEVAARAQQAPEEFLRGFAEAAQAGSFVSWGEKAGLSVHALPIDNPELFGADPAIDDTVREVLRQARDRLGHRYPRPRWNRLVQVVEAVVSFVHYLRDDLPLFLLAEENGGLGRKALEKALQDPLFAALRTRFGRQAVYERTPLAGGRSDSGLVFPECELPFEVKREFSTLDRGHVRDCYLAQPDDYAATRDRICFLLLLDLRKANASAGGKKTKGATAAPPPPVALYSLRESFWVDGLAVDPQIEGACANAVIVGLVPGNRLRPSSKTVYSWGAPK
jgi:hypothetical protein